MNQLIEKVIEYSIRHPFLVILLSAVLAGWGAFEMLRTPIDAIPDLSENQVIVWTDWMGRSPREVEDQITYPLSVNLQGLAGVKAVRATSEFGFSMINIIFDDSVDFYFARQRVIERLSLASSYLPEGVTPYLAQDATALGQIFWYTVEGDGESLDELRSIQDWTVRYQLNSVPGVAQVASVGGFVREYQIDVDPDRLRAYGVSLAQLYDAVMRSNSSVGGKVIARGGSEYLVRGVGWIRSPQDIESIVVATREGGVPVYVRHVSTVQLGPEFRRGALERDGREAVGGVVLMRYGENPLEVTRRVKEKIRTLQSALPEGVRIVPFYDRTGLIYSAIDTLRESLVEEILVAGLAVIVCLLHLRSTLVATVTLPLAVLVSFIFMKHLGIASNIMSLSGIAISIGVLIDAGVVMTENAFRELTERFGDRPVTGDTREIIIPACKTVGPPIFFSVVIMLVSFAPVFALGGMEGKMFHPLAFTKAFALVGVSVLAITLVPALLPFVLKGRLRPEEKNWVVRTMIEAYEPVLKAGIRWIDVVPVLIGIVMVAASHGLPDKFPYSAMGWILLLTAFLVAIVVAKHKWLSVGLIAAGGLLLSPLFRPLGEEFMPPLDEGGILDMPTTVPTAFMTEAVDDIKVRDEIMRAFPEVRWVVGKVGRADTATDPAPPDMIETIVSLHPIDQWPRRRVQYSDVEAAVRATADALAREGVLGKVTDELAGTVAMEAASRVDAELREICRRRLDEFAPDLGRALAHRAVDELTRFLRANGRLTREPDALAAIDDLVTSHWGPELVQHASLEHMDAISRRLWEEFASRGWGSGEAEGLVPPRTWWRDLTDALREKAGLPRRTLSSGLLAAVEEERADRMDERVQRLNWELQDRIGAILSTHLLDVWREAGTSSHLLRRDAAAVDWQGLRDRLAPDFAGTVLWRKQKADLVREMDSAIQMPGWGNIWTQPIINRVDMLATGVRTMIGVKVFGPDLDGIQGVSNQIAAVLRRIPGAVDVVPDQVVGENYLEVDIDRERAARFALNVGDVQDAIEVALGGRTITMTVEGRERYPVRVRYPRDLRQDEESVRRILVSPSAEMGMMGPPVPLGQVADVRVVSGPSMIKSEDGQLRAYVQLNVRDRDILGFVEEAQAAVAREVALPEGFHIEWSGQFEHQLSARRTLMLVLPLVLLVIFVVLYMTYDDFIDALLMMLAVPGAIAGGILFQYLWGHNFSVAVWVGYIACFGMATETGIVMLVFLREAIDKRGGLAKIASEAQILDAVIEGAAKRLRPKLLTESTTIIGLVPMLWATGTGAEIMRPLAAPVLGGVLLSDLVILLLIPIAYYVTTTWRWRRLRAASAVSPEVVP